MVAKSQHSSQAFASDEVEAALAHFKIMERVKGPNIFDIISKFYPEVFDTHARFKLVEIGTLQNKLKIRYDFCVSLLIGIWGKAQS